jgi:N4-gp56 family major capsid protein
MQNYSTDAARTLQRAELELLKFAEPKMVLGAFGATKEQPERKSDTVTFRRLDPFNIETGASGTGTANVNTAALLLAEGTTPSTQTISYTDVPVTLENYGILFKYSSKAELMYEDDIPRDMIKVAGQTMGVCAEKIIYSKIISGSSVIYTNGVSRANVNTAITLDKLRLAKRKLEANWATPVSQVVKAGPNYDTSAIPEAYIVFIHTDAQADVEKLDGYTPAEKYASQGKLHDREIGSVAGFRFITSPLFAPIKDIGGTPTGMVTSGTKADVYPFVVIGEDAYASVTMKGQKGTTNGGIQPIHIPSNQADSGNPLQMFGFVGAKFWLGSVLLNQNFMTRIEAAVSSL